MLTILLISIGCEPTVVSAHHSEDAAWDALVQAVDDRWSSRMGVAPLPHDPQERVRQFFDQDDALYFIGEGTMPRPLDPKGPKHQ